MHAIAICRVLWQERESEKKTLPIRGEVIDYVRRLRRDRIAYSIEHCLCFACDNYT